MSLHMLTEKENWLVSLVARVVLLTQHWAPGELEVAENISYLSNFGINNEN